MNELITGQALSTKVLTSEVANMYTRDLKPETKRVYASVIREFFGVDNMGDISIDMIHGVTPDTANEWAVGQLEKGLTKVTVNKKLSSMQSFYKFLCRRYVGVMTYNPFSTDEGCIRYKNAAKPYSDKISLTPEQIKAMVNGIQTDNFKDLNQELEAMRDYLVLSILITAGLRRAELADIKIGHIIQAEDKWIVNVVGKGEKPRLIVLSDSVKQKIDKYIALRGLTYDDKDQALITSHSKSPAKNSFVSTTTIGAIVKKYAEYADVDSKLISAHTLRHTYCTLLLDGGLEMEDVSVLMGHSNVNTTRRYDQTRHTIKNSNNAYLCDILDIK